MPVKGKKRYVKLLENIQNPGEYIFRKNKRRNISLSFITRPNKISFEVPDRLYHVFKEIFMEDVYNINMLVKSLPQKPVVVDIGANAGFFNIILLSKIKEAKIYAYEPLPSNVSYFKKTLKDNLLIKDFIQINQVAVTGTEKESLDLYMEDSKESQVVASVFSDFNIHNTKKITVPCISLSEIIKHNNLQKVDLLKIDCEGSEYDILYNTPADLLKLVKHITVEVHDVNSDSHNFNAMKKYLESLNYVITSMPINNFCYAVEAVLKLDDE